MSDRTHAYAVHRSTTDSFRTEMKPAQPLLEARSDRCGLCGSPRGVCPRCGHYGCVNPNCSIGHRCR